MIKLDAEIQRKLLSLPESGMGYQIVEATYSDYSQKECLVMNATIAEPTNNRNAQDVLKSISLDEANRVYKLFTASTDIIDVRLKADKGIFKASIVKLEEAKGADQAQEEMTEEDEHFVRFSHFEDDKRIDKINKKALSGTYATTAEDAEYCIDSKIDPIARYALPSILTIEYAFHIRPLEKTPVKRGTVEPTNNQPGGGPEVLFTKGTDNNTVSLPPEKL